MHVFISVDDERRIVNAHYSIFCLSLVLDIIALLFVLKQTPKHMAEFRQYLLLIQMNIFLSPIVLFPMPAVYCVGLLCKLGVPIHILVAIMIYLAVNVCLAIICIVFFRHQALLLQQHPLKLKPVYV
ncbi:hypothetical protein PENTCL1PPCAC_14633, partial [Pristionchus entomophagus]